MIACLDLSGDTMSGNAVSRKLIIQVKKSGNLPHLDWPNGRNLPPCCLLLKELVLDGFMAHCPSEWDYLLPAQEPRLHSFTDHPSHRSEKPVWGWLSEDIWPSFCEWKILVFAFPTLSLIWSWDWGLMRWPVTFFQLSSSNCPLKLSLESLKPSHEV